MEITHNEQFDQTQPEERKRVRINSPSPKGKAINTAVLMVHTRTIVIKCCLLIAQMPEHSL